MCASLYNIDKLATRLRFIFISMTLAIAALTPMQDASAQSDLAAMNQQVIRGARLSGEQADQFVS
jgi:hypothetical protein